MNILKNKKSSLVLKTLGSVVGLSASTALLLSPGVLQSTTLKNNNFKNLVVEDKSLNESSKDSLTNSEFYFESFEFFNPDQGEETLNLLPVAKEKWAAIRNNLKVYSQFSNVPSYQYIEQKINELNEWADSENFVIREALRLAGRMDVWEDIKHVLEFKEFDEVAGTKEELDKNIKILSGYVFGSSSTHRIRSLENKPMKSVNLETGAVTNLNLPGDYKTVVTIAEIDPALLNEDIKIDFTYSSNEFSAIPAQGSLIIRNKNGQIVADNSLAKSQANLEIFGRWTNLGNNNVGTNNFRSVLNNFVLSKRDDGKILVIARLKDGEQLSNIRVEGVESFGIINSQIDGNPIYPETDMINSIKFFSTNLLMTPANSSDVPGTPNNKINKKYEFYIGNNTEFNLNLFYKNINESIYKELFAFEGDKVSDTVKQALNVGVVDGKAVDLSSKKVEFSDEVISELGLQDSDLSTLSISLKTEKSKSDSLYKQSIYLNDLMAFAIFGSPVPSQGGVTISLGSRITEKIFFEDPGFEVAVSPTIETSSTNAIKWINSENQVIAELARIYDEWSKETGTIGNDKLGQKLYNKISYENTGDIYKNITWRSESNNYTGKQMYQNIVEEYAVYQKILSQLIPSYVENKNIYEVGSGGTSQNIVKTTLLSIENKAQRTLIIENVKAIIDSTSPIKDLLIEQQLAELVRIKFSEMRKTLTDPINTFYYNEIKKYLDSETTDKVKISSVDSFLKFDEENGLFNLTSQKVLETQASLTGSEKMKSLFDLLYFGYKTFGDEETFFGNAIFGAVSTNGGNESILDIFIGFNNNSQLSDFSSSSSKTQIDSINIYDRLLSIFGFGINGITEESLKTGNQIELSWDGVNLETAIATIFDKFDPSSSENVVILEKDYEYNAFNSLITSANIYNSLTYRKHNPPVGILSEAQDAEKITNILQSGIISYIDIFAWSRIQKIGNDIDLYTSNFSRNSAESLRLSNEIKTKLDILDRFVEEQDALFQVNPFLNVQIIWPILVGLIAVGMITVSAMSLAGTRKTFKLSSKPVVKIILIVAILISIAALGLIGGLVIPGLL